MDSRFVRLLAAVMFLVVGRCFTVIHADNIAHPNTPRRNEFVTGADFDSSMKQPLSAIREQAQLRSFLNRIGELRHVSVIIDRRIDPDTSIKVEVRRMPFRRAIEKLAEQADARVGMLGGTLLIGPEVELDRLLTLAIKNREELRSNRDIPVEQRVALVKHATIKWDDLDRPVDIIANIEQQWGVVVDGIEAVPHDLWGAGTMVDVDFCAAMMIVLGQFDLTFEFNQEGDRVLVIPAPLRAVVEESHRTLEMTADEAELAIRKQIPNAEVRQSQRTLKVKATMLEHEAIAYLIGEKMPLPDRVKGEPTPLIQRTFPVTIVRTPLIKVLEMLVEQEVDVRYNAEELRRDGANLDKLINVKFENATADEFFTAILKPAGIAYEIDGSILMLKAIFPEE